LLSDVGVIFGFVRLPVKLTVQIRIFCAQPFAKYVWSLSSALCGRSSLYAIIRYQAISLLLTRLLSKIFQARNIW
jgi:hypothetical protein